MGVMRRWLLAVWLVLPACGFDPRGDDDGRAGDDAAGPDAADGDGPIAIDAATDDAAAPDGRVIDAPPIDAPPSIDARPPCPVGYDVTTADGRYAFRPVAAMHALASADCNDDLPGRTHLATFENEATYDADIAAVNPGDSALPYVGGVCNAVDCALTGSWFWSTGPAIDVSIWEPGQPNNGATQRVTVAEHPGTTWVLNNTEATQTRPYICECDP